MIKSRFQQEISGDLGDFWVENAKKEVAKMVKEADENGIIEEDGAIKWKSSGNYLPSDCCEKLAYAGYPFSMVATAKKREIQTEQSLKEYRERMDKIGVSQEQIEEMRAAFGKGREIVDVLTGKKIKL